MQAIDFPQRNVMLAEHQAEYDTLPVYCEMRDMVVPTTDPEAQLMTKQIPWSMTACFEFSKEELDRIKETGVIWYSQMLFGNQFQPMIISTENPLK